MLADWLLIVYIGSNMSWSQKVTETQCKAVIERSLIKKKSFIITCVSPSGELLEYKY